MRQKCAGRLGRTDRLSGLRTDPFFPLDLHIDPFFLLDLYIDPFFLLRNRTRREA